MINNYIYICQVKTSIIFQSLSKFIYYSNQSSIENIVSKLYTCGTQLQVLFGHAVLFGTLRKASFVSVLSCWVETKGHIYLNKPEAKSCRFV